ncbi:ImmA/IrrE family metallo-endopeptidase [Calderihabitans maritimus]|uniref:ImmA/IrrE family metallo-endopeptidase n=1 Tax=Calderihabitans maritimus TaxID=1246530 RepID=UPI001177E2A6|nr:ImmA/IrrE family metallo-endopeptidase [Calderihabitans maritimus]
MNTGMVQALKVVEAYNLHTFPNLHCLRNLARQEDIIIGSFPFKGRITETYIRTPDGIALLTVKRGLPEAELKHALAHGLGHHFLHKAPGIYVQKILESRLEEDAEDFAAVLLVPPAALKSMGKRISPREMAHLSRIPYPLACRRADLAEKYML